MPHSYREYRNYPRNIHNSHHLGKPDDYYMHNVLIYFIKTRTLIRARELEGRWWLNNNLENITRFITNDFFKVINPRFANFPEGTWRVYCDSDDVQEWFDFNGPETLFVKPEERLPYGHNTFFRVSNGDSPPDGGQVHPEVMRAWHIRDEWQDEDNPVIYHHPSFEN